MRIQEQSANNFFGTHKGATIQIDREPDGRFYILVWDSDGSMAYVTVRPNVSLTSHPVPTPNRPIQMGSLMSALPPRRLPRTFAIATDEEPGNAE